MTDQNTTPQPTETTPGRARPKSAAEWGKRGVHTVVLPSNTEVDIRIPDIPKLIKEEKLPNHLIDVAIRVAQGTQQVSSEHIKEQPEFYANLVALTVVEPQVTAEDCLADPPLVPYEDQELLVELATRQRDLDAEGNHIAGLDKSEKWRKFRGLDHGNQDVEDVPGGG
jgi:hypothetical protein